MGIVTVDIDVTKGPTKEQIEMLEKASKMPSTADDEFPEFTKEQLQQFKRISADRKAERQKQTVAIRISQGALHKAKSLGEGYTTVLSRIIEETLKDPEAIKKYL